MLAILIRITLGRCGSACPCSGVSAFQIDKPLRLAIGYYDISLCYFILSVMRSYFHFIIAGFLKYSLEQCPCFYGFQIYLLLPAAVQVLQYLYTVGLLNPVSFIQSALRPFGLACCHCSTISCLLFLPCQSLLPFNSSLM